MDACGDQRSSLVSSTAAASHLLVCIYVNDVTRCRQWGRTAAELWRRCEMGADREEGNVVSDHNKQLQKDRKGDFILTRFKTEKWQTEVEVRGRRGPRWICDTVFTAKFHLFVFRSEFCRKSYVKFNWTHDCTHRCNFLKRQKIVGYFLPTPWIQTVFLFKFYYKIFNYYFLTFQWHKHD